MKLFCSQQGGGCFVWWGGRTPESRNRKNCPNDCQSLEPWHPCFLPLFLINCNLSGSHCAPLHTQTALQPNSPLPMPLWICTPICWVSSAPAANFPWTAFALQISTQTVSKVLPRRCPKGVKLNSIQKLRVLRWCQHRFIVKYKKSWKIVCRHRGVPASNHTKMATDIL